LACAQAHWGRLAPSAFGEENRMRLVKFLLAAAVVVPPVAVASAQDAAQPQRKERQICRREPVTGTRVLGPRVCMTKREWDGVADTARDDLTRSQSRQVVVRYGLGGRETCPAGIAC
jgi:hypothetical protein